MLFINAWYNGLVKLGCFYDAESNALVGPKTFHIYSFAFQQDGWAISVGGRAPNKGHVSKTR